MATTAADKRVRRVKPAEERRRDLLDAALVVFVRDGLAEATIEEVTRTAGMSKGSFYLHFTTKDELAAAAWERHMTAFAGLGEAILADASSPLSDRLVAVLESLTRFVLDHGEVHRALYAVAGAEAVKNAANERLIDLIAGAARAGLEAGVLSVAEPEITARALYHGYCGAVTDVVAGSAVIDAELLIRHAGAMTRAVFPPSASA
ncbi:AcrR family transcriptional regulator [Kineococcus radiotolerans]|uniref:AcrR family transcriptional regulator n=1 Tax=Kineococcus radiotolerans TaxID=131568 RepID=A0A7W4TRH7_KINRA|nr:TetR/AcrR family transcriptional regulator [Kineococcus radiotolerans]MBB2903372.1 AcrR family transcriptional regulator [Kineococcus radiotolerans]